LLGLYYFRWNGTSEELKEYLRRVNEIADGTEGASFKGVFAPSSEWNCVLLFEGASFDKIMGIYKAYIKKYGSNPKIPVAKVESLFTFEEVGYTT
jgi:hypothetical protein